MSNFELLRETLEKNKEEYLNYLMNLVNIKTENIGHGKLGGYEEEGQIYLKDVMEPLGFETKFEEISESNIITALENYGEGDLGHNYKGRFNLLGSYNEGVEGKSIVFNGHIDTMPPGDASKWSNNPYEAHVKDNRLYGLGTSDMKSGLMASILAVKLLKDAGIEIPGEVKVMSVADEEGGGNGTINSCINGVSSDFCIVTEPSDLKVVKSHMGFVVFKITVKGKALHCGKKWEGVNAIENALKFVNALSELERKWLMLYSNPLLAPPTINLGKISGGTAASTVPNECEIHFCAHFIPEMRMENVIKDIEEVIENVVASDRFLTDNKPLLDIYQRGNPFKYKGEHGHLEKYQNLTSRVFGEKHDITGVSVGNDARLMMNISNIPTIISGPGFIEQCHSIDEYVEIDDFYKYILLYSNYILEHNKGEL